MYCESLLEQKDLRGMSNMEATPTLDLMGRSHTFYTVSYTQRPHPLYWPEGTQKHEREERKRCRIAKEIHLIKIFLS